jgi:lysyl-tRNA synthetase class 2
MAGIVTKAVEALTSAMAGASTSANAPNEPKLMKDDETGEMVSKSEHKKRQRARAVAAKKAEKKAATPKSVEQKKADVELGDLDPSQVYKLYHALRCLANLIFQ